MERENYNRLDRENQKIVLQMRALEMRACKQLPITWQTGLTWNSTVKYKKVQSLEEQNAHVTEMNVLRNKIKELEADKARQSDEYGKILVQIDKEVKEKEKLVNEVMMMRRLQLHVSNQLASRWTKSADSDGRSNSVTSQEGGTESEAATSRAVSAKSVKFADNTKSSKTKRKGFVRPTASSALREVAASERIKEKEEKAALLEKLKSKKSRKIKADNIVEKKKKKHEQEEQDDEDDQSEPGANEVEDQDEHISDEDFAQYDRSSRGSRMSEAEESQEENEVEEDIDSKPADEDEEEQLQHFEPEEEVIQPKPKKKSSQKKE